MRRRRTKSEGHLHSSIHIISGTIARARQSGTKTLLAGLFLCPPRTAIVLLSDLPGGRCQSGERGEERTAAAVLVYCQNTTNKSNVLGTRSTTTVLLCQSAPVVRLSRRGRRRWPGDRGKEEEGRRRHLYQFSERFPTPPNRGRGKSQRAKKQRLADETERERGGGRGNLCLPWFSPIASFPPFDDREWFGFGFGLVAIEVVLSVSDLPACSFRKLGPKKRTRQGLTSPKTNTAFPSSHCT